MKKLITNVAVAAVTAGAAASSVAAGEAAPALPQLQYEAETPVTPQLLKLMNAYIFLLAQNKLDDWIKIWADDAVLEFPYSPKGRQSVYVGKPAILEYHKQTTGKIKITRIVSARIHQLADPNTAISELEIEGSIIGTNAQYDQKYVTFFQMKDGKLWRYREYWNPLITIAAFGGDIKAWTEAYGKKE